MIPPIILRGDSQRRYACQQIMSADKDCLVTVKAPRRSAEQNAKMWAMLTDVARAKPEDREWTTDAWKAAFLHALGHEIEFGQALDGRGFFPLGFRSSRLSVKQMSDLIECIYEYGSRHGVQWNETRKSGFDWRVSA